MAEDADEVLQMLACLGEAKGQPLPPKNNQDEFSEADLNMKSLQER